MPAPTSPDTAPCMTPDTGTLDRHLSVSHDAQTLGLPTVTWSDRPDAGSFVVDATLLQVGHDQAVLCRPSTSAPPSCDDDVLPVMDIDRRADANEFFGYTGPFAVTVAGGVVRRHVALLGVKGYWGPRPTSARP